MSIFGMGVPELLVILAIALLLFGPKNLPKLGKSLGATVKSIREGMDEGEGKAKDTDVTDVSDTVEEETVDSDDAVFCNKCGAKNAAGSEYCNKCGSKIEQAQ
jgi:hypothetical protein